MANKPEFKYAPMFQLGKDDTEYRLLTKEGVSTSEFEGHKILKVSKDALTLLAQQAFHDCEFMLRRAHNEQVAAILSDPGDSRCGRDSRTRKHSHSVSITPILRTICATRRMLR